MILVVSTMTWTRIGIKNCYVPTGEELLTALHQGLFPLSIHKIWHSETPQMNIYLTEDLV